MEGERYTNSLTHTHAPMHRDACPMHPCPLHPWEVQGAGGGVHTDSPGGGVGLASCTPSVYPTARLSAPATTFDPGLTLRSSGPSLQPDNALQYVGAWHPFPCGPAPGPRCAPGCSFACQFSVSIHFGEPVMARPSRPVTDSTSRSRDYCWQLTVGGQSNPAARG